MWSQIGKYLLVASILPHRPTLCHIYPAFTQCWGKQSPELRAVDQTISWLLQPVASVEMTRKFEIWSKGDTEELKAISEFWLPSVLLLCTFMSLSKDTTGRSELIWKRCPHVDLNAHYYLCYINYHLVHKIKLEHGKFFTIFQANQAWNRWILHKLCQLLLWILIFWPIRFYLFTHICTLTQNMFMLLYRNGLLIEHNLVEVNGQNVVGLKVSKIIRKLKETPCY